jgi:hypothetical protein
MIAQDYREFYVNSALEYADFAEKCVDTIDSYGLGFALIYWLWNMRKHIQPVHPEMYAQLNNLFYSMITPNLEARININAALFLLEKIIVDSGLLAKHGMKIVDNMTVSSNSLATASEKPVIIKVKKSKKTALENLEPGACVQGKERNPNTGRCINICKPGYMRNADFKCVKQKILREKPKSASSSKKRKRCPNGTRRNKKTGNCE